MPKLSDLSKGTIPRIMNGEEIETPILQILGVKRIMAGDTERLRLLVSDGQYFNSYAMLATQLNSIFSEDKLKEYTIVKVDKYITSVVHRSDAGKRILIILDMTILHPGNEVQQKIGDPVSYSDAAQKGKTSETTTTNTNKGNEKPTTTTTTTKSMETGGGGSTTTTFNGSSSSICPSTSSSSSSTTNNPYAQSNGGGVSMLDQSISNGALTHPISSLSPYQNKWVIKARVVAKSPIRTWSNAKGEGKLFSMDLMDESGEIRITGFREQCDKFYDMIELEKVYFISKCQLKPANKKFTTLNHEYEMTMTNDTVIQLCNDDNDGIPDIRYDLIPITKVANMEDKSSVDVIGICKDVGELQVFTARSNNREMKKRDLTLVDMSNASITLTIWGEEAVNFDGHLQPVILLKGARINEFNGGKSLSCGNSTSMKLNPDTPEGHKLRGWYDNGGADNVNKFISARTGAGGGNFNTEWRTFFEARNLGTGDKPDYFQTKAVVHLIKSQNAVYKACPQPDCNKKVLDEVNGFYRCERCVAEFPNFKYRLLVNMSIGDWTSNRWVTCFSDLAEQLLGRSAQEIGEALDSNPAEADNIFSAINFQSYIFKLRCKMETFGDMTRNKLVVQSASPINYKDYNKYLIDNISEMTGIGKQTKE